MQFYRCKPAGRVVALVVSVMPALLALVAAAPLWASTRAETPLAPMVAPSFDASRKYADKSLVTQC